MPGRRQGIDEPRLHRARVEGEPEPHEDGDDREREHAGTHLRKRDVQERRRTEHGHREEEGYSPAQRVGDDAGRNLEQDHPRREGGVRHEDLEEAEPRVEEKQRVDAPDRRRGERVEPREEVVPEEDLAALVVDAWGPLGNVSCATSLERRGCVTARPDGRTSHTPRRTTASLFQSDRFGASRGSPPRRPAVGFLAG